VKENSSGLLPGSAWPLGASSHPKGVNFAVYSAHATGMELCLFDADGEREVARVALPCHTDGVWHGFLPDAEPGLIYGYRAHGLYEPTEGHRFNPNKLLLDPYARRWQGSFVWHDANFGYIRGHLDKDLSFDKRDSAPYVLKSVVVDSHSERSGKIKRSGRKQDVPTQPLPLNDCVIYEGHVKGLTALLPGTPGNRRGSYRALGSKKFIRQLQGLGVNVLELLPVHGFVNDEFLVERGLVNYWGYQSLGFFLAEPRYSSTDDPTNELREAVGKLHKSGIQVLLDVL